MFYNNRPMQFRRVITKLWTIPYNALLMVLIFVTPYVYKGNVLHDQHVLSLWQMPLSMKFTIMAWIAVFVAYVLGVVIKWLYYKPRPIPQLYSTRWQKIDASSFPSMHTAITYILAYYGMRSAFIFTSWYIEIIILLFWILLCILIPVSRVKLKRHYRSDVIVWVLYALMIIYNTHYIRNIFFDFW
jgi:membrane-associated phospholipid phosphatase